MARRPTRVWKRARRRLLVKVKKELLRLVADKDKQVALEDAGKTPLYLALPDSATWTDVTGLLTLIGTALTATA